MRILTFILGVMQTNCYFLIDDKTKKVIVIDPAASYDTISEKIKERGLSVECIILTHAHFDHMMALNELRKNTGAPLLIHSADNELLVDSEKNLTKRFTGKDIEFFPADKLLKDGDIIDFHGNIIKVLHTPGHTKGSCCFIGDGFIISGDTLFRDNIGRYDFYSGDYNVLKDSLKKLKAIEGNYKIYPGHGASTTLSYEKENNIYLK